MNESHAQACTFIIQSSDINVKASYVIRYTVLSQNFHFCCFRSMAYMRL